MICVCTGTLLKFQPVPSLYKIWGNDEILKNVPLDAPTMDSLWKRQLEHAAFLQRLEPGPLEYTWRRCLELTCAISTVARRRAGEKCAKRSILPSLSTRNQIVIVSATKADISGMTCFEKGPAERAKKSLRHADRQSWVEKSQGLVSVKMGHWRPSSGERAPLTTRVLDSRFEVRLQLFDVSKPQPVHGPYRPPSTRGMRHGDAPSPTGCTLMLTFWKRSPLPTLHGPHSYSLTIDLAISRFNLVGT